MIKTDDVKNKEQKTPQELVKTDKNSESLITETAQKLNITNKDIPDIKRKRQFKDFYKLAKSHKVTTAVLMAKSIGVTRQTIAKWMEHKLIRKEMSEAIDSSLSLIKSSKDWKAHAYIIDKITASEDKDNLPTTDLKQLIVINT